MLNRLPVLLQNEQPGTQRVGGGGGAIPGTSESFGRFIAIVRRRGGAEAPRSWRDSANVTLAERPTTCLISSETPGFFFFGFFFYNFKFFLTVTVESGASGHGYM